MGYSARRGRSDHPRSRGVYGFWRVEILGRDGSSPLARGLHRLRDLHLDRRRIIPARAGFTAPADPGTPIDPDHPRSRGVYHEFRGLFGWKNGSSPLARGLPVFTLTVLFCSGIIPARAGFTLGFEIALELFEDHPRSRGVYVPRGPQEGVLAGSSPLARGLHERGPAPRHGLRIIPARAGFTLGRQGEGHMLRWIIPARAGFTGRRPARRVPPRDHPRSRGVYGVHVIVLPLTEGSSPLARGLLADGLRVGCRLGIIPARAGFTHTHYCRLLLGPDHPRSRGVYQDVLIRRYPTSGSSPLARGLPEQHLEQSSRRRIIPARAGFTILRDEDGVISEDHPRSRGVYCVYARESEWC